MVAFTITTDDERTAEVIEPGAPLPSQRLEAIGKLVRSGIPTAVRIDPIIPFVNDNPERLVKKVGSLGVKHITSSTYKVRPDNWRRLSAAMPQVAAKLRAFYFEEGERLGDYLYLSREVRMRLMGNVRALAEKNGVMFGCCREGLSHLNTGTCDGSWLL